MSEMPPVPATTHPGPTPTEAAAAARKLAAVAIRTGHEDDLATVLEALGITPDAR